MPSPSPCSIFSLVHVAPNQVEWFASGCGINPNTNPEGSQTPAIFLQLWFGEIGYGKTLSLEEGYYVEESTYLTTNCPASLQSSRRPLSAVTNFPSP